MSAINCADCIYRSRESDFKRHVYVDYCQHPLVTLYTGKHSPVALSPELHALTPDHSEPPVYKRRPEWCPRCAEAQKRQEMP